MRIRRVWDLYKKQIFLFVMEKPKAFDRQMPIFTQCKLIYPRKSLKKNCERGFSELSLTLNTGTLPFDLCHMLSQLARHSLNEKLESCRNLGAAGGVPSTPPYSAESVSWGKLGREKSEAKLTSPTKAGDKEGSGRCQNDCSQDLSSKNPGKSVAYAW